MHKILLYQPKREPNELLSKLRNRFKELPEVKKAHFCMASYLNKSEISEKVIIGIKLNNRNKKKSLELLNATNVLGEEHVDLLFVTVDDENFGSYLSSTSPFYDSSFI